MDSLVLAYLVGLSIQLYLCMAMHVCSCFEFGVVMIDDSVAAQTVDKLAPNIRRVVKLDTKDALDMFGEI